MKPKMEINLRHPRGLNSKKEAKKTLAKKEATQKTPEEEVKDFISEFNLGSLLPEKFNGLDKGQKLKVIQDLKRRIVDIVKSDAQTQYSEDVKTKGLVGKLASSFLKEARTESVEKNIFEKLKNSDEGREILYQNLDTLTKKAQTQDIYISTDGKACVNYLKKEEGIEKRDGAFYTFLSRANYFASIPYEWGQEKSGKNKKEYEKAKIEYEQARNEILKIKTGKEKQEEKGKAMLEILETDNVIKMEQLLNTHPEFEKVLENMAKDPSNIRTSAKFVGDLINTLRGKTWANTALMAGGFGARWGTKSLAVLAGGATGMITAIAAPVIGGVIGGIRGRIRGNETLQERQKQARRGIEDNSKEANKTIRSDRMASHLEKIITILSNPSLTEENRNIHLARLKIRIDVTKRKIEQGLMDFGDSKRILTNQFNLVNNLNQALVISASLEEKNKKEIDLRIEKLLSFRSNKIEKRQKEFIKEQTWKGVRTGAAFATAGYILHGVGEHLGWWGGQGTENFDSKQTETPTPNPTLAPQHPTAPTETLEAEVSQQEAPKTIPETAPAQEPTALQATPQDAPAPLTPPVTNNFANVEIKFEHGKGGIQGVLELLKQKDPNTTYAQAIEEAKKLGLYDPNNPEESALIQTGSTLKFDDKGNIIFHDAKTGDVAHYTGKMFDSDGNAKITKPSTAINHEIKLPPEPAALVEHEIKLPTGPTIYQQMVERHSPKQFKNVFISEDHTDIPKPTTAEELTKTIHDQLDAKEPAGTVHTGSIHSTGSVAYTGSEVYTGSEAFTSGGYYGNQPLIFNGERYYPDSYGQYHNALDGRQYFPDISDHDNLILGKYPVFTDNPFHLSGKKLMQVYETSHKDLEYLFENNRVALNKVGALSYVKAGKVLEYEKMGSMDPTALRFSNYLNSLKNFSGLKPRPGFLGIGAENSGNYIARALQKLAATGKLEIFEKNLRQ